MTERKPFQFEAQGANQAWNNFLGRLFHQRHRELERIIAAVKAAPVPMPDDVVSALAQLGPTDIREALCAHPGFSLWEMHRSYQSSYEVFGRAFDDLLSAIERFEAACKDGLLYEKSRDEELKRFEIAIQKELFAAANAAHSLVDHSTRKMRLETQITGYAAELAAAFGSDGLHETIIGLRNALHHFHALRPGWQWSKKFEPGAEVAFSYSFGRANLVRVVEENKDKLSNVQRIEAFLSAAPEKIEIRALFTDYRSRASAFHAWLAEAFRSDAFAVMHDYDRCLKENKKLATRLWWNAMLGNWLQWETPPNPYDHLARHLTKQQLEEVYRLPMGSPEQVDKVIEFVDVDGACDEGVRKQTHELFRRAPKPAVGT